MKATNFKQVIEILQQGGVDFILIGGLAANAHGAARVTYDIDVVYSRAESNLHKLVTSLSPIQPYLRGAPPGLPFNFDVKTLRRGLNFTLDTTLGDLDLLGEATGGGTYDLLIKQTVMMPMFGLVVRCAPLDALIRMKTAAGRPKDFEALAELHALRLDAERPLDEPRGEGPLMPLINTPFLVDRLIGFQKAVRDTIIASRDKQALHEVSHATAADTIYKIDTEVEPILDDFCRELGKAIPLVLIAEGLEDENGREGNKVFPEGTKEEDAKIRLIVDPIDGTRGIMYDKRPAWALAGIAPNKGPDTRLRDIEVAVMTELPTGKMGYSDVLWAVKGQGAMAQRVNLATGEGVPLAVGASRADTIKHGFATVSNFFPGTKVLASELMEHIVRHSLGAADVTKAMVFDDQYISTGGQFYELINGHDRFNADLRPAFYAMQGQPEGLCCHPYDCAALLVAEEAGVMITDEKGQPLDGPLDCTTGLNWVGYANAALRQQIEPLVRGFFSGKKN